jgi:hypothetical protein
VPIDQVLLDVLRALARECFLARARTRIRVTGDRDGRARVVAQAQRDGVELGLGDVGDSGLAVIKVDRVANRRGRTRRRRGDRRLRGALGLLGNRGRRRRCLL